MVVNEFYEEFEPLSISAVPAGWRAIYIADEGSEPGWYAEPLIALAIYQVTMRPCHGSHGRDKDEGHQLHGVVDCDGYFGAPGEVDNFWRYQAPGAPDPTAEEVTERRGELDRSKAWLLRRAEQLTADPEPENERPNP